MHIQVLIRGVLYSQEASFIPDVICKMHVREVFAVFYIRERVAFANIAKIKRSRIKDGLQYDVFVPAAFTSHRSVGIGSLHIHVGGM